MDQQNQANKMVLFQQKEPPYYFFYVNDPTGLITAQNAAFMQHMSLLQHHHATLLMQLHNNYLKQVNDNDPRTNDTVNNNVAQRSLEKISVNNDQNAMIRQKQYLLNQNQNYNNGTSHPKALAAMKRTKAARPDYQKNTKTLDNVKEKRKRKLEDDDDEVVVIEMKRKRDDEVAEIDLELRL